MALLFALLLLVAGVLGAAGLIVKNQPNAKDVIAKLVPFQGVIGIVLMIWSLIQLIRVLPYISSFMSFVPLTAILLLATLLVGTILGFLLGYGLIKHYALKSGGAASGGDAVQLKLAGYQGPLGLLAIGLAVWLLINVISGPMGMM